MDLEYITNTYHQEVIQRLFSHVKFQRYNIAQRVDLVKTHFLEYIDIPPYKLGNDVQKLTFH